MGKNLKEQLNSGITPAQFMETMEKNKEKFQEWYTQFAWEAREKEFFTSLQARNDLRCLILAAEWCGDVVRNIPAVFQVLAETQIPTEVLIMEENLEVMDQFLTYGGRAIPIVIFTDAEGTVLGQWGPRPAHVQEVMAEFKKTDPDRNAPDYQDQIKAVYAQMNERYGEGTAYQRVIVQELQQLLSSF